MKSKSLLDEVYDFIIETANNISEDNLIFTSIQFKNEKIYLIYNGYRIKLLDKTFDEVQIHFKKYCVTYYSGSIFICKNNKDTLYIRPPMAHDDLGFEDIIDEELFFQYSTIYDFSNIDYKFISSLSKILKISKNYIKNCQEYKERMSKYKHRKQYLRR